MIKNGKLRIRGTELYYNCFGKGPENLIMIPGLGDGLRSVKGAAMVMAMIFRAYAKQYRVWILSRSEQLEPGMNTREMAGEVAEAMDLLDIDKARVLGISMGGMIAQWLAIDHPDKVQKLVIAVSLARQNETIQTVVGNWVELAEAKEYGEMAVDTMLKTYTDKGLKKWRPFFWLVRLSGKPSSQERFLIQARACLSHDAYPELSKISCPTLVIGGGQDKIVGDSRIQQELAAAIPNSKLHIYPELGHGAYQEAKDFNQVILDFLQ